MKKSERIVRASADEIRDMRARGDSQSDWTAAETLTPAEVERLAAEDDGPLPNGWESTVETGLRRQNEVNASRASQHELIVDQTPASAVTVIVRAPSSLGYADLAM